MTANIKPEISGEFRFIPGSRSWRGQRPPRVSYSLDAGKLPCRCKCGCVAAVPYGVAGRACPHHLKFFESMATSRKLMDEFIVDDRSGKSHFSVFEFRCVLRSHYPPLADDIRVLLAGNLFRHLEHHLDQGVDGKALRPCEQDPALADVLNNTLVPRAGFVHAIAQRDIELQAA